MAEKKHNLQVILTITQYERLHALADPAGDSLGHAVRQLIDVGYKHSCLGHPTCPDGQRCFVPQMHDKRPSRNAEQLNDSAASEPVGGPPG